MESVERGLIASAIAEKDFGKVLDAKITSDHFINDDDHRVFEWARDYWMRYNTTPTANAVRLAFPNYTLRRVDDPVDFYIDSLHELHRSRMLSVMLAEVVDAHESSEDANEALRVASNWVQKIHEATPMSTDRDMREDWQERLEYYDFLREHKDELIGIPTSFPTIDEATNGIQPEQMVVLIGQQKAGKSWIMMQTAKAAHESNRRVMFVSFEMTTQEQAMRLDCMMAELDASAVRAGKITDRERRRLETVMKRWEDPNRVPFIFSTDISRSITVSGLAAKIEEHKPDVVFIDGAYMMQDESSRNDDGDAQKLTHISRGLKRLAQQQKVAIILSTQALGWKTRRGGKLDANSAGYTSAWGQDADVMFGVEKDENDDERLILRTLLSRNSYPRDVDLRVDWTRSLIEEEGEHFDDDPE